MNIYKICFFSIVMIFSVFNVNAQTKKQFNGKFQIYYINSGGDLNYDIKGIFTDITNTFKPSDVLEGDIIVDKKGNSFEIIAVTYSGNLISTTSKAFDNNAPIIGDGVIFRPTSKGFALVTGQISPDVLSNVINTTTLNVDATIPNYKSGSALPSIGWGEGDIFKNTSDGALYKLTASGWLKVSISGISTSFYNPVTDTPAGKKGDLVKSYWDNKCYVFNGTTWVLPQELSSIPVIPKFGDVFYDSSQEKIFMLNADSEWSPISGSTIPKGTLAERPATGETGDFFYDTDNAILYIYGSDSKWSEVSTDGSTPSGVINPDPASGTIREGNLFYNTSDHRIYVYNGTMWMPMENTLPGGQIYVGNSSNIATPVEMFGDATISNNGKIVVKEKAITDEKLDKFNIPLSGFANPIDNVSMGNGTTNNRIINLANPIDKQDAVTKSYIDIIFSSPETLLSLPEDNFFVGNISNKAAATAKSSIPISGFGNALDDVSLGDGSTNFRIINLANPTSPQDAASKNYVDTKEVSPTNVIMPKGTIFVGNDSNKADPVAKTAIPFSDFGAAGKDISLSDFKITNLAEPVADADAATKNYVDTKISNPSSLKITKGYILIGNDAGQAVDAPKSIIAISDLGGAGADVAMGNGTYNFKVINMADPTNDQDAATKKYVDDQTASTPSGDTNPSIAEVGDVFYNTLEKKLYVYNGTEWIEIGAGGSTPGGDVNPPAAEVGDIFYNTTDNKLYVYNGTTWVPVGLDPDNMGNHTATETLKMGGFKILNLADPTELQDAATKKYVDDQTASTPSGDTNPATANSGDVFYNTLEKKLYVYNGTEWVEIGAEGSTPGGDVNPPTADVGDVFYNTSENKLYVYNGTDWAPVGIDPDNMGNHTATETLKMGAFAISNDGDPAKGLTFDIDGNATFSQSLTVNGNFYTPSDKRLKTNIETLTNVLDKINNLRGVSFEFKDKTKYASGLQIGFIAQELLKEFPELVSLGSNGFYKVNYTQLTAVLLQAIKEQQVLIKMQKSEINKIKEQMLKQQQQIELIMKKMDLKI